MEVKKMQYTNQKIFEFADLNGNPLRIYCNTYETRTSWGHIAESYSPDVKVKHIYYNRTWESFEYESVLLDYAKKLFPLKKDEKNLMFLKAQIKAIADKSHEETEKWVESFEEMYKGLSEGTKEVLKRSVSVESLEQADALIKGALLLDLLK